MPTCSTSRRTRTIRNGPRSELCRACWRRLISGETMNRMKSVAFRLALVLAAAIILLSPASLLYAQQQPAPAPAPPSTPPPDAKAAAKPTPTDEMDEFSPKPAPPLPAGMTGSDTKDPRYPLKAGMYNAGEAASGIKHVFFLKKPGPFRLDATSPDDPQVDKTLALR